MPTNSRITIDRIISIKNDLESIRDRLLETKVPLSSMERGRRLTASLNSAIFEVSVLLAQVDPDGFDNR